MRTFLTCCIITILAVAAGAVESYPEPGGWQVILEDYDAGKITLDEKAQLVLTLLVSPQDLPPRYQIDRPMKDATAMLLDILAAKNRIDPSIIRQYFLILTRQNKQAFYDTPEGHLRIHYDTTGYHAVYQPGVDIDPPDGVPDYVNRTAEYFERAWFLQCDTLTYDTPPYDGANGGGSNLYDVYMHRYSGAYGVTWPENYSSQRPNRNYDMTSYIYVDPTFDGFGYNDRTLPMKVTSAHEFFHAVQFAYNALAGGWFMENCATWMEDVMWDDINDNYLYMSYFFNFPHYSITTANGAFEYGAFVWPTFLEESYGLNMIHDVWVRTIYLSAFDAILETLDEFGSGIQIAYPTFATWNFITGARDDGGHYEEGGYYNSVRIMRSHSAYPVNDNTSYIPPNMLGSNYVMFVRGDNSGALRIVFNGDDNAYWTVPVVKSLTTNEHEFDVIELNNDEEGEIIIPDFENYSAVTIIPCNLSGSSANFVYSASLDTLTSVSDYPEELPDDFVLHGNYPNPFNDRTVVVFEAPGGISDRASLNIYDLLGRKVRSFSLDITPGLNRITVSGWNNKPAASGLYYYRLIVGKEVLKGMMTYLK